MSARNCAVSVAVAVIGGLPVWKYARACCMISLGEQRLFAARSFNNDSSSAVNQRVQAFRPFWRFASRQRWTRADSLIGRASLWEVAATGTVTGRIRQQGDGRQGALKTLPSTLPCGSLSKPLGRIRPGGGP